MPNRIQTDIENNRKNINRLSVAVAILAIAVIVQSIITFIR